MTSTKIICSINIFWFWFFPVSLSLYPSIYLNLSLSLCPSIYLPFFLSLSIYLILPFSSLYFFFYFSSSHALFFIPLSLSNSFFYFVLYFILISCKINLVLLVMARVYIKGNKIWYTENFSAYGVTIILRWGPVQFSRKGTRCEERGWAMHWRMGNLGGGGWQQQREEGAASQNFQIWQLWMKMNWESLPHNYFSLHTYFSF